MAKWKSPSGYKYSKSDEWYKVDGDLVMMGITDYAQDQLSDIVYVEFPDVGTKLDAGDSVGSIESVKAASDVYTAIGGEVARINSSLEDSPEQINEDPYEAGWLVEIKVSDLSPLDDLMDSDAYAAYCESRQ
ncbi:MAG: glycine cleavage system protein GcvH [Anaerolineales bacterium]|nr:glycine cleavage system protein GcvH [Anaerolineales bacterium]